MVNPRAANELAFPEPPARASQRGRFAVIGGGPAGMESARALAAIGHEVVLFEAEPELGGQFRMARRIPGKREFNETIRYYTNELARLGVGVRLNERCRDASALKGFAGLILAAGVVPRRITLEGSNLPHVISYADLLLGNADAGSRVAIVGAGGIGVDIAHYLSFGEAAVPESTRFLYEQGLAAPEDGTLIVAGRKHVALLRRGRAIGEHIGKTTRWAVLAALRAGGVNSFVNVEYDAIVPGGIRFRDADGIARFVEADSVVIAAGQERNDSLLSGIQRLGIPYRVAGGAKEATELDAVRAFDDGLRAAYELGYA
jgi:2,4-dienoyl-CoA reductase (NADPH2)